MPVWISGTPFTNNIIWHFILPCRALVAFGEPYYPDEKQSNKEVVAQLREKILEIGRKVNFGDMQCPKCDYDLHVTFEIGKNECPECGCLIWDEASQSLDTPASTS